MKTKRKCVLDNKVYIFIRDNAKLPIWHYYFTHNGDQFRGSTGHRDVGDATVAAISRYKAVRDGEVLVQTTRTSFKDVAERWLKVSETNRDIANKRKAVEKFFIPYFHDVLKLADIGKIRQSHLTDYIEWRRAYHTTGPGSQKSKKGYQRAGKRVQANAQSYGVPKNDTLNRENQNLNQIIAFAKKEGFIDSGNLAHIDKLDADGEVRPAFTSQQCDTLIKMAKDRMGEDRGKHIQAQRRSLYNFVVLLRYTGLRPHEGLNLRWADIDLDRSRFEIRKGKTGKRVVPMAFPELIAMFRQMLMDQSVDGVLPTGYIFTNPNGKRVGSFKTSFETLVQACGFKTDDPKGYSLYSFRHHLATYLTGVGLPDGLSVQIMGTSRRMMDAHYDHSNASAVLEWFDNRKGPSGNAGVVQVVAGAGSLLQMGSDGLLVLG